MIARTFITCARNAGHLERSCASSVRSLTKTTSSRPVELAHKWYNVRNSTKKPIVSFHGLMGTTANLHRMYKSLQDAGYPVLAADLRNHGRSPHTETMTFSDFVSDAVALIRHEIGGSSARVHVLGHSLGGKVGMGLAMEHPKLVSSVTALDVAPVALEAEIWNNVAEVVRQVSTLDPSQYTSRNDIQKQLRDLKISPSFIALVLQNLLPSEKTYKWRCNMPVLASSLSHLADFPYPPSQSSFVPLHILAGEPKRGSFVTKNHFPQTFQRFPSATITCIPNSGHWLHVDALDPTIDAVLSFLARQS